MLDVRRSFLEVFAPDSRLTVVSGWMPGSDKLSPNYDRSNFAQRYIGCMFMHRMVPKRALLIRREIDLDIRSAGFISSSDGDGLGSVL